MLIPLGQRLAVLVGTVFLWSPGLGALPVGASLGLTVLTTAGLVGLFVFGRRRMA